MENNFADTPKKVARTVNKIGTLTDCWVQFPGDAAGAPSLDGSFDTIVNVNGELYGCTRYPFSITRVRDNAVLESSATNYEFMVTGTYSQNASTHYLLTAVSTGDGKTQVYRYPTPTCKNPDSLGEIDVTALQGMGSTAAYYWCFEDLQGHYCAIGDTSWTSVSLDLNTSVLSVVTVNGVIYLGCADGKIYTLSADSTTPVQIYQYPGTVNAGVTVRVSALAGLCRQKNYANAAYSSYVYAAFAFEAEAAPAPTAEVYCLYPDGPRSNGLCPGMPVHDECPENLCMMAVTHDGYLCGTGTVLAPLTAWDPVPGTYLYCPHDAELHTILPNNHTVIGTNTPMTICNPNFSQSITVQITATNAPAPAVWDTNFSVSQGNHSWGPAQPANPLNLTVSTDSLIKLGLITGNGWIITTIDIDPHLAQGY